MSEPFEIVMDAPGKNALGEGLMDFLLARLEEAQGRPVLLTGANGAFSAGLNLKEVHGLDRAGMEAFLKKLERLVSALFTYPGPTVAAVNGHAIAGGCVLALCCDHRVGTQDGRARIGLNEVALGLVFPPGILRMLQRRLGPLPLGEAILGAALHDPPNSVRLGFLDELAEDPLALARERLAALARHPADAYAKAKRALRGETTLSAEDEATFRALLPVWVSQPVKDRIRAVLTKK